MSHKPLSSLRVIDCGTFIAAPAAATVLSDFGAEVIKIERPPHGDPYRYLAQSPQFPSSDLNYCWILSSRNKKSLALNLGDQAGREILLRLLSTTDVFITNFQSAILRRFHLTYEDLLEAYDRLIYAHVTGYGDEGAEAGSPGYDLTAYFARSGLMAEMRTEQCEPTCYPLGLGDHPTAMSLVAGIFFALYQRELTGRGMKVSTSLMANGAWTNSCLIQAAFCGAQWPSAHARTAAPDPLINSYVSRDGVWFHLALPDAINDWLKLCRALDWPELADDPRFRTLTERTKNAPALIELFDAKFALKHMAEWRTLFARHEVAWAPVQKTSSVIHDAQMEANGVFARVAVPGSEEIQTVSNPLSFQGIAKQTPRPAPEVGQDTCDVLSSLGLSTDAIAELEARGVVKTQHAIAARTT